MRLTEPTHGTMAPTRLAAALAALALVIGTLAACAPSAPTVVRKDEGPIVFPGPPDEPRFVFERAIFGASDVVPTDSTTDLRRAVTGEGQTGDVFGKPYGVAVFGGRIYVTDTVQRFVLVLDVPRGRSFRIGDGEGQDALIKPIGIDIDGAGRVYVADISQKRIVVYDGDGKFIRKIGRDGDFSRLTSVTVNPEGTRVYAVDLGGVSSELHRVRVYDAVSGDHVMDIGRRGAGPGEMNHPRDLAIGKDGRLYVVDGGNFRVLVFDREGRYLTSFGSVGKGVGQFARPKEIAVDRNGNVYVADTAFGTIQIFNADGEVLMFMGSRDERQGPAKYLLLTGVAVDEDGRVYAVDQWFRRLDVFRPTALAASQGALGRRPAGK